MIAAVGLTFRLGIIGVELAFADCAAMVLVAVMRVSCGRRDDNALCLTWSRDGEWRMKVNVEIDCTPEEARRAMGLPDLTPIHERYVQMMLDTMQSG